jgi:hypothetical protein
MMRSSRSPSDLRTSSVITRTVAPAGGLKVRGALVLGGLLLAPLAPPVAQAGDPVWMERAGGPSLQTWGSD